MISNEQPAHLKCRSRDTAMGKNKRSFGKRFSQFLSKIFWHLDQQPIPNCSFINQKRLTSSSSSKKSIKKHESKTSCKTSAIDRNYIRSRYPAPYRSCLIRQRTSTLSSIQEE